LSDQLGPLWPKQKEATMSYALISERAHKAMKRYRCIWCGESILPGQTYVREFSIYDGDTQKHKWHLECRDASAEYFREVEEEFMPHEMERPATAAVLEYESWDCALLKQAAMPC
jgi:hypothetical protein